MVEQTAADGEPKEQVADGDCDMLDEYDESRPVGEVERRELRSIIEYTRRSQPPTAAAPVKVLDNKDMVSVALLELLLSPWVRDLAWRLRERSHFNSLSLMHSSDPLDALLSVTAAADYERAHDEALAHIDLLNAVDAAGTTAQRRHLKCHCTPEEVAKYDQLAAVPMSADQWRAVRPGTRQRTADLTAMEADTAHSPAREAIDGSGKPLLGVDSQHPHLMTATQLAKAVGVFRANLLAVLHRMADNEYGRQLLRLAWHLR